MPLPGMMEALDPLVEGLVALQRPDAARLAAYLKVALAREAPNDRRGERDAAPGVRHVGLSENALFDRVEVEERPNGAVHLTLRIADGVNVLLSEVDPVHYGKSLSDIERDDKGELVLRVRWAVLGIQVVFAHRLPSQRLLKLGVVWPAGPATTRGDSHQTLCSVCFRPAAEAEVLLEEGGLRLRYRGPGGSNGERGDPIEPARRVALHLAFVWPYSSERLRRAGLFDEAGFCSGCQRVYCATHWSLTPRGGGFCPEKHFKSLDPHFHPDDD